MWLSNLLPGKAEIRPTRPTSKKYVGRLETIETVRPSDTSDTSDIKICNAQAFATWEALPMSWTPSEFEDRPCCWLPVPLPERMRGLGLEDLQGFGIPAEGLPSTLRQFSRNGWRLRFDDGGDVEMVAGPGARREDGCRAYLDAMRGKVKAHLRQWEGTLCG